MKLYSIDTELFKLDGGAMFGVVPKSIWHKLNPADENNLSTWAMRCLLVKNQDRLILIDCGIGNKQSAKFFSYYYLHGEATLTASLAKHGFTCDDITDVFLTHLHFDHVGGAVVNDQGQLRPTFRNATYWSTERHWQLAVKPNAREKASFLPENILPIQESGKLKFVPEEEGYELFPDFRVRFVNGHTAAMMLPQLDYHGKTLVYTADLLPSLAHLPLPYVMAYDMQPLVTLQEKAQFLNEALQKDYTLFFEHDKDHECCTLGMTDKGIRAKATFLLNEFARN